MEVESVEDILQARELFSEIRELLDDIKDEQFKTEYLEKLFNKQKEFLKIEAEQEEELNSYLKQKEEESRVKEESKEENGNNTNAKREAFLSALSILQSLEYQDGDTEALISEAIARLKDLDGASDISSLSQQLEKAINRVRRLPTRNSGSGDSGGPGYNGPGPGNDTGEADIENGPGISP